VSEGSPAVRELIEEAKKPIPAALSKKKRKQEKEKEKAIAAAALAKHETIMASYKKVLGSFLHS
jgi:hypothetical protein